MSQNTKRANPRVNTSVQRNNFSLGSSVRNSTLLLANSSYMNKGILGPLVKECHLEVELEYLRSSPREASENNHQGDVRGLIPNNATLIPFVGMVRLRD